MSTEATGSAGASSQDALELLRADHRRIDKLIADCERLSAVGDTAADSGSDADRAGLVSRLAAVLKAHAQVEDELFYPALPAQAGVIGQARGDHAEMAALLQDLAQAQGDPAAYARSCAALAMAVRDHVVREEAELFPTARALDLAALGAHMAVRRAELLGEQGAD